MGLTFLTAEPKVSWQAEDCSKPPPARTPKELFGVEHMAKAAGISRPALTKHIANGVIQPSYRAGRQYLFDERDLAGARTAIAFRQLSKWKHVS